MLNRSKVLAASLIAATFVAGGAVGSVVSNAWGDHDRPRRNGDDRPRISYSERLQNELGLSDVQRESVEAILTRRQDATRELWHVMRPRFDTLRMQVRADIAKLLDDNQRAAYQALIARSDSMYAERERRDGRRPR